MSDSLTQRIFHPRLRGAAAARVAADQMDAIRREGDRLAREDVGLPPRLPTLAGGLNGGYKPGPPAAAPTERETAQAHNGFVLGLLRGAQDSERSW